MYPNAIIYQADKSPSSGSFSLRAPLRVKLLFAILQSSGVFVIGLVIYLVIYSLVPVAQAEVEYATNQIIPSTEVEETKQVIKAISTEPAYDYTDADKTIAVQNAAAALGVDSHFSVVVPKINAKSKVIDNVDASNEKIYSQALKQGVAHAQGTFFPGQGKLIYLFSHSTNAAWNVNRYSAVFYLLKKLEVGDSVMIFFADKEYEYLVTEVVVAGPKDTSWLDPNNPKLDGETLILQTCTPAGTNLKRLLIIAKPVDNGSSSY